VGRPADGSYGRTLPYGSRFILRGQTSIDVASIGGSSSGDAIRRGGRIVWIRPLPVGDGNFCGNTALRIEKRMKNKVKK